MARSEDDRWDEEYPDVDDAWLMNLPLDPATAPAGMFVPLDAVDEVVEMSRQLAVFAAHRAWAIDAAWATALADGAEHGRDLGVAERSFRLELAQALRVTEATADRLVHHAGALVNRYRSVLDALGEGRVTERHAEILIDTVDQAEEPLRADLTPVALELAERLPLGVFRHAVRKLVEQARAVTLTQRHDEALRMRRVIVEDDRDGMAWLSAYLPAVEARAILNRLTGIGKAILAGEPSRDDVAETSVGDEAELRRTLDQVRADILGDLLVDGQTPHHPDTARGIRATVAVTVPVLSLLDDEHAASAPAEVDDVGPIPNDHARILCSGADGWMRVLTHPETGTVLSVGRTHYRPPADLKRLIRWRAGHCTAPGCRIPAHRCEIDHTHAWEHGGHTRADNLTPLCKGHHTVKHHGGWTTKQHPDGSIAWTSPTGRTYTVEPERRTPRFHPEPPGQAPPAPF